MNIYRNIYVYISHVLTFNFVCVLFILVTLSFPYENKLNRNEHMCLIYVLGLGIAVTWAVAEPHSAR